MRNTKINDNDSSSKSRDSKKHDHAHGHPGACDHDQDRREETRGKLLAIFVLTALYTIAEAAGGLWTGSLALLADAGHMAVDALALGLALAANRLANRSATENKTFGYFRLETLTAFVNAATLLAVSASIFYEAGERLFYPAPVESGGMTLIAAGGLLVNLLSIRILHGHHDHDLNSRGAWLHILGDTLGSAGAVGAGVFISITGRIEADAAVGVAIAGFIVYSSWALLKKSVHVLLEGAPAHLSFREVERSLLATDGVVGVHDLHLWEISSGREALSCHVVHGETVPPSNLLVMLQELLRRDFGIRHLTLQMEPSGGAPHFDEICRGGQTGCFGSRHE